MTLSEAIAIKLTYDRLGYPNRATRTVLAAAERLIKERADQVVKYETDFLCTTCWGDGFHRVSTSMLNGPCHACGGTGRAALKEREGE